MAENVTHFFEKDTNGIPNWAWLIIVVAGLGVGYYLKKSVASSTSTSSTSTYTPVGATPSGNTQDTSVDTGTGTTDTSTTDTSTTTTQTAPAVPAAKYVTVEPWPAVNSTLTGIASSNGISLSQLLAFPENTQYRNNPNLIYAGQQVRVA